MNVKDAAFAYGSASVFRDVNLNMRHGERVQVTGPNGSGKSTLLRLIGSGAQPTSGSLETFGKIGYLSQVVTISEPRLSVAAYLGRLTGLSSSEIGGMAGSALAKNPEHVAVSELSEGELRKLWLIVLLAGGYDALVLDEPTNHMDVFAIEALEKALTEFTGAVIFVSHDRRFAEILKSSRVVEMKNC